MTNTNLWPHGFSLATIKILYRFPDFPKLVAPPFIWQCEDEAPKFPRMVQLLNYWEREVPAVIERADIYHALLIKPHEILKVDSVWKLH